MEYRNELDIQLRKFGFRESLSPKRFVGDLARAVNLLWVTRNLTIAMALRELRVRHAGQFVGALWIVGHPILQMAVYIFIFGVVFKQRIGGTFELPRDYTAYILSGLVPWLTISTTLPTLCTSVLSNANLVKQFAFRAEILTVKDVIVATVFWGVGIVVIMIYELAVDRSLPWTFFVLPFVLVLNLLLVIGLGWTLSAIGVFVRDMKEVAVVLVSIGLYVLPVVYLPSWTPSLFRPFVEYNPLSALIWVYQDTLYFGRIEHPGAWIVFATMSVACFGFGYRLFQTLKPFFGRVL